MWPLLAALPCDPLRVVDAGCGTGGWTLELAACRPNWSVVGVDRDRAAIARAERARTQLSLSNVEFVAGDFRDLQMDAAADVVLSVLSAHYLAAAGDGPRLFRTFAAWLRPGGLLLMLAPRSAQNPFAPALAHPTWHNVFSSAELADLCECSGFTVEILCGRIGRLAILAKQLAWETGQRTGMRVLAYPLQWMMTVLDSCAESRHERATLMWLLMARAEGRVVS